MRSRALIVVAASGSPSRGATTTARATGDACLIGVGTARHPKPDPGATVLQLDD
jgi:hypothetical protein